MGRMDDLEDELDAIGESLDWLNEAHFREAKTGLDPADPTFKVLEELGEAYSAMTAFRDHMQRPFDKHDTAEAKLVTFRMLIKRLHNADRWIKGIQTTAAFKTISAKVQDAVAAAYAQASATESLSTLCITVLKAVFDTNGVTVENGANNTVEVSMELETGGLARFRIDYNSTRSTVKKFKSLRVSVLHSPEPPKDLFLEMSDTALQTPDLLCPVFMPRGNDGSPSLNKIENVSKASAAELLDWPLGSDYLELKFTTAQQAQLMLSHLILQSGLFSDLGNTTQCRASFVDKALF